MARLAATLLTAVLPLINAGVLHARDDPTSVATASESIITQHTITDLPYPYQAATATVYKVSNGSQACLASLAVRKQNSCGRHTSWLATTTVALAVDCLDCSELVSSVRIGGCPLGGSGNRPTHVYAATKSEFDFVCAPTPAGTSAPRVYKDTVTSLPVPALPSGFAPAWTPTAVTKYSWAEGRCNVDVALEATDSQVRDKECQNTSTGPAPTVYTSTVTQTVSLECGGCAMEVDVTDVHRRCPRIKDMVAPSTTITASEPTTTWAYVCRSPAA